ncbi:hypothetical protein [Solimonas terrae]|uniref:Uncharacterized protein n=1 Tax=Solimonas terrae TaxID=1396819 RepID=A0A6M2BRX2_9GAMM|nr:hypothetical protein [Solimonas terrae]NGY04737.1 hypothetical protein [Solimonas terrae]
MATWQLELQPPPREPRALELWLQHAAGRILLEDVRAYAVEKLDKKLTAKARAVAEQAIDDALYGVMMVLDGVTGAISNAEQQVELSVQVKLIQKSNRQVIAQQDIMAGDEMCMGYHGWLEGDYGEIPVAKYKLEAGAE